MINLIFFADFRGHIQPTAEGLHLWCSKAQCGAQETRAHLADNDEYSEITFIRL